MNKKPDFRKITEGISGKLFQSNISQLESKGRTLELEVRKNDKDILNHSSDAQHHISILSNFIIRNLFEKKTIEDSVITEIHDNVSWEGAPHMVLCEVIKRIESYYGYMQLASEDEIINYNSILEEAVKDLNHYLCSSDHQRRLIESLRGVAKKMLGGFRDGKDEEREARIDVLRIIIEELMRHGYNPII